MSDDLDDDDLDDSLEEDDCEVNCSPEDDFDGELDEYNLCEFCKERVWVSWKGPFSRYDLLICATCLKELYEDAKEELKMARERGKT